MAVRLRLTRVGSRKNPIWRVVVADGRSPRDGRILETVGRYNPQRRPSEISLDRDRIDHWLARGAQPSEAVRKLITADGRDAPPPRAVASAGAKARSREAPAPEAAGPPAGQGDAAEGDAAESEAAEATQPEGADGEEAAAEPAGDDLPTDAEAIAQSDAEETGPAGVEVPAEAE